MPRGLKGDVALPLIEKAIKEGLMKDGDDVGIVELGGRSWTIDKRSIAKPGTAADTAKKATGGLERFKEQSLFAKDYTRVALKVFRDVSQRATSVDLFVKAVLADMKANQR